MQDVKVYSLAGEGAAQLSEHFKVREFRCEEGRRIRFAKWRSKKWREMGRKNRSRRKPRGMRRFKGGK